MSIYNKSSLNSLEAEMWREIGIKLAMLILPTVPAYHSWSTERLNMRLEHAFVPCLKAFKVIFYFDIKNIYIYYHVCFTLYRKIYNTRNKKNN